jgi:hypothetical protein
MKKRVNANSKEQWGGEEEKGGMNPGHVEKNTYVSRSQEQKRQLFSEVTIFRKA